jgi:2-polyprenyl-3-methyl-5-hydroxy-6-metoxy-1,4-benzoquinol methylase
VDSLDWDELRDYWEHHAEHEGRLDPESDPDALGNVCWPGQPLWLNRHLANLQEAAYDELLGLIPPPRPGQRALDVGCGSGRWCRILARRGFEDVLGIDLQPALIDANRRRMPELHFERTSLQDFEDAGGFDLISSVTVIQHNPFEYHPGLARKMRSLTRDGGHVILLENVRDRSSYTFPHPPEGWIELFREAGFETVGVRPYDFSPALRSVLRARETASGLRRARPAEAAPERERPAAPRPSSPARTALMVSLRAAVAIDGPLERLFAKRPNGRSSIHCGFLFRAV